MIPTYLLMKQLGLLNNFMVYILPQLFSYYDVVILMNFFRQIPASLEESAQIDGAGVWKIFLSIAMPLSKPALATIALFNGVYQWNDFMTAKLYMTNKDLYPVQMKLYEIIVQQPGTKHEQYRKCCTIDNIQRNTVGDNCSNNGPDYYYLSVTSKTFCFRYDAWSSERIKMKERKVMKNQMWKKGMPGNGSNDDSRYAGWMRREQRKQRHCNGSDR